jgi:hypothetical protein
MMDMKTPPMLDDLIKTFEGHGGRPGMIGGSFPKAGISAGIDTLDQARDWWAQHLGGKTLALEVQTGAKPTSIRVEFDPDLPDAYTDSKDAAGQKLAHRLFSEKRARAMDRIVQTIEHPSRRIRNFGADLLLERKFDGEHFTVVLKWNSARKVYGFTSSHYLPVGKVADLQEKQDGQKNGGPLQKSEPPFGLSCSIRSRDLPHRQPT